jgi:hypothetical protein
MRDDEPVPIDPLLKEPLDLGGSRASKRTQGIALLRQLGFENRLNDREFSDDGISQATTNLAYGMLAPLAEARDRGRVHVRGCAKAVAGHQSLHEQRSPIDGRTAATAMLDLGWGHVVIPGGPLRDVLDYIADTYVDQMSPRVETMLRRWEKRGWIADSGNY